MSFFNTSFYISSSAFSSYDNNRSESREHLALFILNTKLILKYKDIN